MGPAAIDAPSLLVLGSHPQAGDTRLVPHPGAAPGPRSMDISCRPGRRRGRVGEGPVLDPSIAPGSVHQSFSEIVFVAGSRRCMPQSRNPTMADVARAANVSRPPSPGVLRGVEGVSSGETAARVRGSCADELGYIVNGVASSMRSQADPHRRAGRSPMSPTRGGASSSGGVESVLGPAGLQRHPRQHGQQRRAGTPAVETLLRQQVDAIIVASSAATGPICGVPSRGRPGSCSSTPSCPACTWTPSPSTTRQRRALAVEHLLAYGHQERGHRRRGHAGVRRRGPARAAIWTRSRSQGCQARPELVTAGSIDVPGWTRRCRRRSWRCLADRAPSSSRTTS